MDPLSWGAILAQMLLQFTPVWIALAVTLGISRAYKRRLGLYGKLYDSGIGIAGFTLVMFWVYPAVFANMIITHEPLTVISGMKNALPGSPMPDGHEGYGYYLLGGDNLARDVFSRMVMGAREVRKIAPAATLFAFMVGITRGLPAG